MLRRDYARAIGDTKLEEQERLLSEQLKTQLGNKKEEYDAAEVSLQSGERIYGELSKDDQEIDVAIVNAGTEPCKPAEGGTVLELEYSADQGATKS